MRILTKLLARKRIAALLAAGLLTMSSAGVALATVAAPTNNAQAPAKPTPNDIVDDGEGGDEGEAPARPDTTGPGQAFDYGAAVAATRDGLNRARIGTGIRQLRILDYILIGGVAALLLLSIVLLVLVAGLRNRIAALTAGAAPRGIAREEEQMYGAAPLP